MRVVAAARHAKAGQINEAVVSHAPVGRHRMAIVGMVMPHVATVVPIAAVFQRAAISAEDHKIGEGGRRRRRCCEAKAHGASGGNDGIPEGCTDGEVRAGVVLDDAVPERGDLAVVVKLHPPAFDRVRRIVGEHDIAVEAGAPLVTDFKAGHKARHHRPALKRLMGQLRTAASRTGEAPAVLPRSHRNVSQQRRQPIAERVGTHSNLLMRCFPANLQAVRPSPDQANASAKISFQGSHRIPAGNCPAPPASKRKPF